MKDNLFKPGDMVKWIDTGFDSFNRKYCNEILSGKVGPLIKRLHKGWGKIPPNKMHYKTGMIRIIDPKYQMAVILNFEDRREELIFIDLLLPLS